MFYLLKQFFTKRFPGGFDSSWQSLFSCYGFQGIFVTKLITSYGHWVRFTITNNCYLMEEIKDIQLFQCKIKLISPKEYQKQEFYKWHSYLSNQCQQRKKSPLIANMLNTHSHTHACRHAHTHTHTHIHTQCMFMVQTLKINFDFIQIHKH